MKNSSEKLNRDFKIYVFNKIASLKSELKSLQLQLSLTQSMDSLLTISEVEKEFKKSRKTIDRWRENGLKYYQDDFGKSILIKRGDLYDYLNNKTSTL